MKDYAAENLERFRKGGKYRLHLDKAVFRGTEVCVRVRACTRCTRVCACAYVLIFRSFIVILNSFFWCDGELALAFLNSFFVFVSTCWHLVIRRHRYILLIFLNPRSNPP